MTKNAENTEHIVIIFMDALNGKYIMDWRQYRETVETKSQNKESGNILFWICIVRHKHSIHQIMLFFQTSPKRCPHLNWATFKL